jgi:hypothetical protein
LADLFIYHTKTQASSEMFVPSLVLVFLAFFFAVVSASSERDKCFDGKFWMDPTKLVTAEEASCPPGYRLAALPDLQAHLRAAQLIHHCYHGGGVAWIGSTMDGETHGGAIAIVSPKSMDPAAGQDAVGGIIKVGKSDRHPTLCERL